MTSRVVETHTSDLFFVGGLVYKRKKPLDLGFCDFRTREARLTACTQEVRLNQRLSPDVYLGVADVLGVDGRLCDHLVVMKELPDDRRLARWVVAGRDVSSVLDDIARQLAALHRRSPAPGRLRVLSRSAALCRLWSDGLDALEGLTPLVPGEVCTRTRELALRWATGRAALLDARVEAGRTYDGHGDLSADDIFVLPDGARLLDCLEFDERLRIGDGISDAAFLAMDLERLGAPDLARYFLDAYERAANDTPPASLEDFYLAYRAHVRSKVVGLRARQDHEPGTAQAARALAELALAHLERGRVRLILVGGLPGTGKSTVASGLAAVAGWQHLSSDATRKRLAGLPPDRQERDNFGTGLYDPAMTVRTYQAMLSEARTALAQGSSVVLDATWLDGNLRDLARRLASETTSDLTELRCTAPGLVADARITRRASRTSEASPSIRRQLEQIEHPWPESTEVDTGLTPAAIETRVAQLVGVMPDARLASCVGSPAAR